VCALSVLGACSDTDTASSSPSPEATAGNSATGEPPSSGGAAGAPSSEGTSSGMNGATESPVNGEAPPLLMRDPPGSESAASGADAGLSVDTPAPACERSVTDASIAAVSAAIDELFVQGDITAVDRHWGEPYLQHNPIAASGVVAFRNLFSGLISPGNSIYELSRVVGECELVLIHGDYTSFGGPTFDMFRVDNGRLVEHWDSAATGAGPNASGHTALDGESIVQDEALTGQNRGIVSAFVDRVLIGGAFEAIDDYMSPNLIEHDPASVDGSPAYVQHLRDQAVTYRQVHHEIADGNFVFVLSEGAVGGTDVAHYDLFRVEASLIIEHWNGRRDVPAPGTTQSGLGIF
jgi:predicted SnoaL-like aldol condensation-catalyzing enzyme